MENAVECSSLLRRLPYDVVPSILARLDHDDQGGPLTTYAAVSRPFCLVPEYNTTELFIRLLRENRPQGYSELACVGFFRGWLAIVAHGRYPSLEADLILYNRAVRRKVHLSTPLPRRFVSKAVVSAEPTLASCFVAVVYGNYNVAVRRVHCKEKGWSPVGPLRGKGVWRQVVGLAFHRGMLWVMTCEAVRGVINAGGVFVMIFDVETTPPCLKSSMSLPVPHSSMNHHPDLVCSGSKLLAVARDCMSNCFIVWECTDAGFVLQSHLEDRALILRYETDSQIFVGRSQIFSVDSEEMGSLERNCIHCTFNFPGYEGMGSLDRNCIHCTVNCPSSVYRYKADVGKFALEHEDVDP